MHKLATRNALPDWSKKFFDPILIPNRSKPLRTLRDAANTFSRFPRPSKRRPARQTAAEALKLVAEHGGYPMLPRTAMMKALHRRGTSADLG
jgi:hypothetical protein